MQTIVVFGASGDLSRRKTFPALFALFKSGHLRHQRTVIFGYARSPLSVDEFRLRVSEFIRKGLSAPGDETLLEAFLQICFYRHGDYDSDEAFSILAKDIEGYEQQNEAHSPTHKPMRIFYLALPPSAFLVASRTIRKHLYSDAVVAHRLVLEKPFGKDLQSSNELGAALGPLFDESEIYRIDHYLGKEMVKNLLILRFANMFFNAIWHRGCIRNVQIVFKEMIGVEGRGGYFDEYGIIRDVMQNHMMQMLTLVAMERPTSLSSADDVRDEKVKVLKAIRPIQSEDIVLGQYGPSSDGTRPGYVDDATVPSSSLTPTFAMATLHVRNERWDGVPFILRCGKALNEPKAEIRIQFHNVPGCLFGASGDCDDDAMREGSSQLARNELVIRVQPNEAVYLKMMVKRPDFATKPMLSELDLSYSNRFSHLSIPGAYEALLLDILGGDQANYVRKDELAEAWRIFTPILHETEAMHVRPDIYPAGSRGPESADRRLVELGYRRTHVHPDQYSWPQQKL